ncbi:MAG: hypothetical protein H8D45_07130 [Bacteroidetes bacterium]|nr:hypothetical protein [Bacteroidota bacterium]
MKKRIYKAEKKMILYCDDIICASEKLRSKFEEISPRDRKIHLISVIADNSSFQKSNLTEYLRWDKIPAPKAVIFGKISHRINFDLIERLSMRIPDMSIVFIGKILDKRFKRLLRNYQNIYHLGFLSRDKIIYCLRSATVGLHPGKKLIFNEYSNPIRIYEYAAAGIPIVAINISRESDYPKTISVVDNDNGFITAVENRFKHGVTDNEKSELVKFSEKHSASEIVNAHIRVFQAAISA